MKFYTYYEQKNWTEIENLILTAPHCSLVASESADAVTMGYFNHHYKDRKFYLHLNRTDEQVVAIERGAKVKVVFFDYLTTIPSHWVDQDYAGAATMYYRFAEFHCKAKLIKKPEDMVTMFQGMMDHYQPEGKYSKIDASSDTYRSLNSLAVLELDIQSFKAKWKLGQNRPETVRAAIVRHLEKRATPGDLRAAAEVKKQLEDRSKN